MSTMPGALGRLRHVLALLNDPRTPKLPRLAVLAAVIYFISPIDVVPDPLLPVLGYVDDFVMVWLALRWLIKRDPDGPGGAVAPGAPSPGQSPPPALLP